MIIESIQEAEVRNQYELLYKKILIKIDELRKINEDSLIN